MAICKCLDSSNENCLWFTFSDYYNFICVLARAIYILSEGSPYSSASIFDKLNNKLYDENI